MFANLALPVLGMFGMLLIFLALILLAKPQWMVTLQRICFVLAGLFLLSDVWLIWSWNASKPTHPTGPMSAMGGAMLGMALLAMLIYAGIALLAGLLLPGLQWLLSPLVPRLQQLIPPALPLAGLPTPLQARDWKLLEATVVGLIVLSCVHLTMFTVLLVIALIHPAAANMVRWFSWGVLALLFTELLYANLHWWQGVNSPLFDGLARQYPHNVLLENPGLMIASCVAAFVVGMWVIPWQAWQTPRWITAFDFVIRRIRRDSASENAQSPVPPTAD